MSTCARWAGATAATAAAAVATWRMLLLSLLRYRCYRCHCCYCWCSMVGVQPVLHPKQLCVLEVSSSPRCTYAFWPLPPVSVLVVALQGGNCPFRKEFLPSYISTCLVLATHIEPLLLIVAPAATHFAPLPHSGRGLLRLLEDQRGQQRLLPVLYLPPGAGGAQLHERR